MFYKSIFQGRLQFNNARSFDKALNMFHHRLENYHKSTEIIFDEEDIFDRENLQVYVPRTVVNIIEKAYKSTVNMLEYISQFAVSGYIGTWMMDDRDIKFHSWMEPESDKTIVQRFLEGKKLTRKESYEEALEKLTQVINMYENHSQAYERRGYVNYKLRRNSDAIRDFKKSITHDDQNAMAYLGLGKLYVIKEEWEEAVKYLDLSTKNSLALQDIHWTARRLKAQAHMALKDFKKAEFELRFYLKRDFSEDSPNFVKRPHVLEKYGIVMMELENYEEAINQFTELIDQYPQEKELVTNAYFYRGESKVHLGKSGHIADFKAAADNGHKRAEARLSKKRNHSLRFFVILSFLFIGFCTPKTVQQLKEVDCRELATNQAFAEAKACLLNKENLDSRDQLLLSAVYSALDENAEAQKILEDLIEQVGDPIYYYHLGQLFEKQNLMEEARESYNDYLSAQPKNPRAIQTANAFLRNYSLLVQKTEMKEIKRYKLDSTINSVHPEYGASLTVDGNLMIFTRLVDGQEDLYEARRIDEIKWEVRPLEEINSGANEGAHCLSADGKILIYTICNEEGFGSCDLFYSIKENGLWSAPTNMGENINTSYWEAHPALSLDGKYLFFSSDRLGGKGGRDIWVSALREEGWSTPLNLGDSVNTRGNEESPFFHPDGKTLYFSSDSWPGYGRADIFKSQNLKPGLWTGAVNIGPEYNNAFRNLGFFVHWSGKKAFINDAYIENNIEYSDIMEVELIDRAKPDEIVLIDFEILNSKNLPVVSSNVQVSSNGKLIKTWTSDRLGKGFAIVPANDTAEVIVEHPDYIFHSEKVFFDSQNALNKQTWKIILKSKREISDQPVVLKNVLFETGSSKLRTSSYIELDALRKLLKENLEFKVEIRGHTDNVGGIEDNKILSLDRANAVKAYLVQKGISAERIKTQGFGENQPLASNDTVEGRAKNRRTEFVLID